MKKRNKKEKVIIVLIIVTIVVVFIIAMGTKGSSVIDNGPAIWRDGYWSPNGGWTVTEDKMIYTDIEHIATEGTKKRVDGFVEIYNDNVYFVLYENGDLPTLIKPSSTIEVRAYEPIRGNFVYGGRAKLTKVENEIILLKPQDFIKYLLDNNSYKITVSIKEGEALKLRYTFDLYSTYGRGKKLSEAYESTFNKTINIEEQTKQANSSTSSSNTQDSILKFISWSVFWGIIIWLIVYFINRKKNKQNVPTQIEADPIRVFKLISPIEDPRFSLKKETIYKIEIYESYLLILQKGQLSDIKIDYSDIKQVSIRSVMEKGNDVVGGALLGGLLFGDTGAVVGGMSELNNDKKKEVNTIGILFNSMMGEEGKAWIYFKDIKYESYDDPVSCRQLYILLNNIISSDRKSLSKEQPALKQEVNIVHDDNRNNDEYYGCGYEEGDENVESNCSRCEDYEDDDNDNNNNDDN